MIEILRLVIGIPLIIIVIGILVFPLALILKTSSSFYKGKKASLSLYFLGAFTGFIWGGVAGIWFSPCRSLNPIAFLVPFLIGSFLPFMCGLPKTTFIKVIFGILVGIFVLSPGINLLFPYYIKETVDTAREKITKKNLNNIRSAITNYYEENKAYPLKLDKKVSFYVLLQRNIGHSATNTTLIISTTPNQPIQPSQITDEGGWIYSSDSGDIRINCSHKDSKGVPYYEW